MAAGTVTQSLARLGRDLNSAMILTITWVGASNDGTVPATATTDAINAQIAGYALTKCITIPGDPAPTHIYNITLIDQYGLDIASGSLAERVADANEAVTLGTQIDEAGFTFTLTGNSVASATGICKLFFNR